MSIPDLVQEALDDEPVAAEVRLGGEDTLFVTPSRTLIYRADGLLSDESIEEFPHGAERIEVSEGRRKSKITLDYGLDGERTVAVPTKRLDDALHPIIAGVLNAAGITDAGETVKRTFRFSELTLVVTSARVVKHIGAAVWDADYEGFHFDDVTDLTFEEGSLATSVVLTAAGRQERFKAPNQEARAVRESLESALLAYHDVPSLDAFRELAAPEEENAPAPDTVSFGDGPDPLSANPSELSAEPANATRPASERAAAATSERAAGELTSEPERAAEAERTPRAGRTATVDAAEVRAAAESVRGGSAEPVDQAADASADDPDPSETDADASAVEPGGFEGSGFESAQAFAEKELAAELSALREVVEVQGQQLSRQNELIEQLIEELRQGR